MYYTSCINTKYKTSNYFSLADKKYVHHENNIKITKINFIIKINGKYEFSRKVVPIIINYNI